jgi:hypothetical protein
VGRSPNEKARRARAEVSIAGRAKILVLVIVAAGSIAALSALLIRREAGPVMYGPSFEASTPAPARESTSLGTRTPEAGATIPSAPATSSASARSGVIRGEVLAAPGAVLPERWTLHVGPHPWLAGHETASDRRIDFEHGETQFELRDLPLGGYLVDAIAPGLNCLPGNVMLVQGSEDQFVTIQLSPSGFIDGGVLDASGRPAEGLEVTLESVPTKDRRTQTTDPGGNFVFREVRDGEYLLLFGRPDSPLLPPQSLLFTAPSMRFPTRTLPPSVSLEIQVVDVQLRPVAGARIRGSASEGGAIDTRCDATGAARIRYLPPGTYRIDANGEGNSRGSAVVALGPKPEASTRIVVRDPSERRE